MTTFQAYSGSIQTATDGFTPTYLRWYNTEAGNKVACHTGPYEGLAYGSVSDREFLVRDGKGNLQQPHPQFGQFQWGIACSRSSRTIIDDGDHPKQWGGTALGRLLGPWQDVATSVCRMTDGTFKFHIAELVPVELLPLWPTQLEATYGHIKSLGFSYIEGTRKDGTRYVPTGKPWVVATKAIMEAHLEDNGGHLYGESSAANHDDYDSDSKTWTDPYGSYAQNIYDLVFAEPWVVDKRNGSLPERCGVIKAAGEQGRGGMGSLFDELCAQYDAETGRGDADVYQAYSRCFPAYAKVVNLQRAADDQLLASLGTSVEEIARKAERISADLVDNIHEVARPAGDGREPLNVTSPAVLVEMLFQTLGQGTLSGIFNRNDELVLVSRYGQLGYRPCDDSGAPTKADPPAQVRPVNEKMLRSFITGRRWCYKEDKTGNRVHTLPPADSCSVVANSLPEMWRGVSALDGVTHTPLLRPDGSCLSLPGYDAATRLLYLPDRGLGVPPVPDHPDAQAVAVAQQRLSWLVKDFPFRTAGDRANYLGMLITPLLRTLLPPPWPMLALDAPQHGSGKSLLSELLRILYGGTEHPAPEGKDSDNSEELRKVISTELDSHTGTVAVFDNVTGVLRSGVLAKLLTGKQWDDRELGKNRAIHGINDRIWVVTGNNLQVGGDLPRRTIKCSIDAKMEHPELRRVTEANLPGWLEKNRGMFLQNLLILAKVAAPGISSAPLRRSDSYGAWDAGIRHVLQMAGVPGGFWETAATGSLGTDDEEWSEFLSAIFDVYGESPWTAKELCGKLLGKYVKSRDNYPTEQISPLGEALPGDLPMQLAKNIGRPETLARSIGRWLKNRQGRWVGGFCIQGELDSHTKIFKWRVKHSK